MRAIEDRRGAIEERGRVTAKRDTVTQPVSSGSGRSADAAETYAAELAGSQCSTGWVRSRLEIAGEASGSHASRGTGSFASFEAGDCKARVFLLLLAFLVVGLGPYRGNAPPNSSAHDRPRANRTTNVVEAFKAVLVGAAVLIAAVYTTRDSLLAAIGLTAIILIIVRSYS